MTPARILVVDDSLTIRRALELILKPKGYALEFAVDGAEALTRAASFSPDLILLDYVLPDMRGPDVCAALSGSPATAQTPVILVSAKGASIRQAYQDAQNVVSYITKPFKPAVVQAVVENALVRRRDTASASEATAPAAAAVEAPTEADRAEEPALLVSVEDTFTRLLSQLEEAAASDLHAIPNGHSARASLSALLPTLERLATHFGDVAGHLESLGVAPYRLRADGSFASIANTLLAAHRSLCEAAIALAMAGAPGATPLPPPTLVLACTRAHPRHAEAAAIAAGGAAVLCTEDDFGALPYLMRLLAPLAVIGLGDDTGLEMHLLRATRAAPPGVRFIAPRDAETDPLPAWASESADAAAPLESILAALEVPQNGYAAEAVELTLDVVTV